MAKAKSQKSPRGKTQTASKKAARESVQVKNAAEVVGSFNHILEYVLHAKVNRKLTKSTQKTIVAYGPWLVAFVLLVVLPQLLIFAKDAQLVGLSSFFTAIFFNQESWILLLIVLSNCLLLADGLSDIFAKKKRGWNRIYIALLINGAYALAQLVQNLTQPAAPLLSLAGVGVLLFVLFDVKKYYK